MDSGSDFTYPSKTAILDDGMRHSTFFNYLTSNKGENNWRSDMHSTEPKRLFTHTEVKKS